MKERELIEQVRAMTGAAGGDLVLGIGDDCAVIKRDESRVWLLTMDTLVESVHFNRSWHPPLELGQKTVAVNVSDIAAMGGRPLFALLSLGLPEGFSESWSMDLCQGISRACRHYGCLLVGGDTVRTVDGVSLTLAVIGEMDTDRVLYRSGAGPGDTVWVSGPLGWSAAGLALLKSGKSVAKPAFQPLVRSHLVPRARTDLGPLLAESGLVHAMMDLSDGLATDLSHLCAASGVGARVEEERLPGGPELAAAAELLHRDRTGWMIGGGEDYELLFTAPAAADEELERLASGAGCTIYRVGTIESGQGVRLAGRSGRVRDITFRGYDHFR